MDRATHLLNYPKFKDTVMSNVLSNSNKLDLRLRLKTQNINNENKKIYEYGETKMAYNANNTEKLETKTQLPPDTVQEGMITDIVDGKVKDFISESAKANWKGDLEQTAINLKIGVKTSEEKVVELHQMLTYIDEDGKTKFTTKSNLGKFNETYKELPRVGLMVKISVNGDGLGKIKLD